MIATNNNDSLSLLLSDVFHVLSKGYDEFENVQYRFDFSSNRRGVKCVRFWLSFRKRYYKSVYPNYVQLFEHLSLTKRRFGSAFSFVRYSVDVICKDGVKIYCLVLWY